MKVLLFYFLGIILLVSHLSVAQVPATEGVITYEAKQKIIRRPPTAGTTAGSAAKPATTATPAAANTPPTFFTTKHQLFYNTQASYYKAYVAEDDDLDINGNFKYQSAPAKNETYIEAGSFKKISVREFNGKIYLISDTLKILPWKFGTETKEILGYPCKQATYTNPATRQTTVAWFTDKLRPSLGPESYCSLPGTILEIDYNKGDRVVRALKVEPRPLRKKELVEPTKGQKKTEKEYQSLVSEHMKKMSSGNTTVRN